MLLCVTGIQVACEIAQRVAQNLVKYNDRITMAPLERIFAELKPPTEAAIIRIAFIERCGRIAAAF